MSELSAAMSQAMSWRLDVKGAEVRAALGTAGVPCLLLKGRAFAALFYADGAPRHYGDCDLLVPVTSLGQAQAVLRDLGFHSVDGTTHARGWHRRDDGVLIDLHHTLPLVDTDPERVWAALSARAATLSVGGAPTRVLDPPAAALLAALHLVHHGPSAASPRRDLSRAIDQLDDDGWRQAADLALELGGLEALGTGLRLLPTGTALADRLALAWAPSPRVLLNWNQAPWGATVWEDLASAPTTRARAVLLARFLSPDPDFLRERSVLARRGHCGLLAAYLLRPFLLTSKALLSFGSWRRARRDQPL